MTTAIQLFNYNSKQVRVGVDENNNPLWVAADVGEILGLAHVRSTIAGFPEDEKGSVHTVDAMGRDVEMLAVTEPGLYRIIFQSRKPEAEDFRRFVFHEVLPSIRKTGQYVVPTMTMAEIVAYNSQSIVSLEKEVIAQRRVIENINNRIEYEVKQAVTVERIQSIEWKERKKLEERVSNLEGNDGFYTIRGYINVGGFKQVSTKAAQELGKRCGKYCREHGLTPKIVPDAQYGEVKKWPLEALEHVFKHVPRRGDKATFSHIG